MKGMRAFRVPVEALDHGDGETLPTGEHICLGSGYADPSGKPERHDLGPRNGIFIVQLSELDDP